MCTRTPALPFLPGYTFNPMVGSFKFFIYLLAHHLHVFYLQIGRTKFNRDHIFGYIAPGVRGLIEKVRPNLFGPLSDRYPSFYPRGEVIEIPAWIAYDKQVRRVKLYVAFNVVHG